MTNSTTVLVSRRPSRVHEVKLLRAFRHDRLCSGMLFEECKRLARKSEDFVGVGSAAPHAPPTEMRLPPLVLPSSPRGPSLRAHLCRRLLRGLREVSRLKALTK